jgi:hypothetical protein
MRRRHVRLVLDLDPELHPVGGRIRQRGRLPKPFTGWMQLASALTEAVAAAPDASHHHRLASLLACRRRPTGSEK